MNEDTSAPGGSLTSILAVAEGMFAVDVLTATLVNFHIPDLVSSGNDTIAEIAAKAGISERACTVAVTLLEALGALTQASDGIVHLTADGAALTVTDSPTSLVPVYEPLAMRQDCKDMTDIMRGQGHGPPATADVDWLAGMSEIDFARMFLRSTDARNRLLAEALTAKLRLSGDRLLDVAGGSGLYTCRILQDRPTLRATVVERPPVDQIAAETIAKAGLSDRANVVAADVFREPLPDGHTDMLLSNVVHDWDLVQLRTIFDRAASGLPTHGQLAIHDVFTDTAAPSFQPAAEYSALLMKFTSGRCYSLSELDALLASAGFTITAVEPTTAHRSLVTATRT